MKSMILGAMLVFSGIARADTVCSGFSLSRSVTHPQEDSSCIVSGAQSPAERLISQLKAKNDCHCEISGANKQVQKCIGKFGGYPEPVIFFVPSGLTSQKPVQVVYHFHGFDVNGQDPQTLHFNEKDGTGDFATWMSQAHLNGVIIAPTSKGECKTFTDYFSKASNTYSFFRGTEAIVREAVGTDAKLHLALTSHSGSDQTLSWISRTIDPATSRQIRQVGLFDSVYHSESSLLSMAKENQIRIFDSYLAEGSTEAHNEQKLFTGSMKQLGIEFETSSIPIVGVDDNERFKEHMALMSRDQYSHFLSGLN